ncbi:MAG: AgmX/PglI C-terminal domain-containing protein [Pseudomonadota bacterium]
MRLLPALVAGFAIGLGCGGAEPVVQRPSEVPRAEAGPRPARARAKARHGPPEERPSAPPTEPVEIDPTEIVFALRGREADVEACRREPRKRGLIQLAWGIDRDGAVEDVEVQRSTVGDPDVERCLVEHVSSLRFNRAAEARTARWTFVFGLEGEPPSKKKKNKAWRSKKRRRSARAERGVAIESSSPGWLEPDAIDSVVQSGYRLYAHCYRDGLARNPRLGGAVRLRFVIGRDGSVQQVRDGGSDLPDPRVIDCVAQTFFALRFPRPERGHVHVLYRLVFDAG